MKQFGETLKEARLKSGLKRGYIGEQLKLGININNWSAWENEVNFPNLQVLKDICDLLQIDFDIMSRKWIDAKTTSSKHKLEKKVESFKKSLKLKLDNN